MRIVRAFMIIIRNVSFTFLFSKRFSAVIQPTRTSIKWNQSSVRKRRIDWRIDRRRFSHSVQWVDTCFIKFSQKPYILRKRKNLAAHRIQYTLYNNNRHSRSYVVNAECQSEKISIRCLKIPIVAVITEYDDTRTHRTTTTATIIIRRRIIFVVTSQYTLFWVQKCVFCFCFVVFLIRWRCCSL